jgi:hypothetical protein
MVNRASSSPDGGLPCSTIHLFAGEIGGSAMKCPYLEGIYFQWCKASKEHYIPSQFEFKEYCTNGGYKVCPGYYQAAYDISHGDAGQREHRVSNGG